MLHRSRELLVKQRTMLINAVRGHCSELEITASQGASRVNDLLVMIKNPDDPRQHSSGGQSRLGRISKRGDGYYKAPAGSRVPSCTVLAESV